MKSISKKSITKIKTLLSRKEPVVLLTHVNPDGDAIGSLLGMYNYLAGKGHEVAAITPNEFPRFLRWLPGSDKIIRFSKNRTLGKDLITGAGVLFCLDFNDPERLGDIRPLFERSKGFRILIDHHPEPGSFAGLTFSDSSVSSTAEIIYDILQELEKGPFLNPELAECLYTGIMTDTGCFSFNSSSGNTFRIVGELLDTGIDKDGIFERVYNNFSADRMRLLGFAMNERMVVLPEYRTAYITLTMEEQERYNFTIGDSEGFVNLPLSIIGIRFSVIFIEKKNHVKISLRSKGNFPVNRFAEKHFNGGGHLNAAGGESCESLEKTVAKFLSLLEVYPELTSE